MTREEEFDSYVVEVEGRTFHVDMRRARRSVRAMVSVVELFPEPDAPRISKHLKAEILRAVSKVTLEEEDTR